jgi:hypothetical protein
MANIQIIENNNSKYDGPVLYINPKKTIDNGCFSTGFYIGLLFVKIIIHHVITPNAITINTINPNTKIKYERNFRFKKWPTNHQLKLICAKFVKDVLSDKTTK